jgi:uncharacterized protein (TIGR00255 family)
MPRSMTGFGAADGPVAGGRLYVEVRSVNHRHFNVQFKLPAELAPVEADMRERLRSYIHRGHVTVSARWTEYPARAAGIRLDLGRARQLLQAWRTLSQELQLPAEAPLEWIAKQPGVLEADGGEEPPLDRSAVLQLVDQAAAALVAMREREGAALARALEAVLARLALELERVERRAPERLLAERDRLRKAAADLLDGLRLDETRLAQEIAVMAERVDIAEEVARLKSHLEAARAGLAAAGPVGRELGFLGQEMLREINTIGSKASDAVIAQAVIAMKSELEQFREQVENLE